VTQRTTRTGAVARAAILLLVALVMLLSGLVAGRQVLSSVEPPPEVDEPAIFEVVERTLERSMTLGGEATWAPVGSLALRRDGTVTTRPDADVASFSDGDVLATVDLEPVVLGDGDIPAFRELRRGVRGEDVAQLQRFLARHGDLETPPDGRFQVTTERAVKTWQERIGAPTTGVVRPGDVVWTTALPAVFRYGDGIRIGAVVAAGAVLLEQLGEAPTIVLRTSEEQANLLPVDPAVVVHHGGQSWEGRLGTGTRTESDVDYPIEGDGGAPVCGRACTSIPAHGVTQVDVEVIVVPSTTGPAVPQAALRTDAGGDALVRLHDGREVEVDVRAAVNGMAVVDGLEAGQRVVLP
jgi:peptidoglycan hydrolase-like protein with peptidoglycan-binding domain